MKFKKLIFSTGKFLRRHSGKLLTMAEIVGLIGTTALAIRGTKKLENEPSFNRNYIRTYAPMVIVGGATIAAMVFNEILNERTQAQLAAAYIAMMENYRLYRSTNVELNGQEADDKIIDCMASKMMEDGYGIYIQGGFWDCSDNINYANYPKELFYDSFTGQFFQSTMPAVQDARYHLNRNMQSCGICTVDDFLSLLGIGPETNPYEVLEDQFGWNYNYLIENTELSWIDISITDATTPDGVKYHKISYVMEPITHCGSEYWD